MRELLPQNSYTYTQPCSLAWKQGENYAWNEKHCTRNTFDEYEYMLLMMATRAWIVIAGIELDKHLVVKQSLLLY